MGAFIAIGACCVPVVGVLLAMLMGKRKERAACRTEAAAAKASALARPRGRLAGLWPAVIRRRRARQDPARLERR